MHVYVKSDQGDFPPLYTVGFYDPAGKWHAYEDFASETDAAERVHWLNGGDDLDQMRSQLRDLMELDAIKGMFAEEREYQEAMADAADARSS